MTQFKYSFLALVRNRPMIFWTLLFPMMLGTFFFVAFGNINEVAEKFSEIPVAVVMSDGGTSYFTDVLDELAQSERPLVAPKYVDMEQARELLSSGEADGIFEVGEDIRFIVSEKGINQSILKSVSDSFIQIMSTVETVALTRPEKIEAVLEAVYADMAVNQEITLGRGETNDMIQYFYALIAMTCLFGSFFGSSNVAGIQAQRTPLAARRCVSPVRKISMIIADFAAAVLLLFGIVLVVLAYLIFVLRINFGETWGFVILTGFVGSIVGVSFGTIMGALLKTGVAATEGILVGLSLTLCFLSGLMFHTMRYIVEQYAPIINRINPAALLSDAFYSLTAYTTYTRYAVNIISLLVISGIFCFASALILRRKRYASI